MHERAKLSDVARLAGVSPATASRALNGLETVDPDLARRVHEASRKLGYRRNSLARGLRRRANDVVGVVVPDVTNPFFTDLVRGVEDVVEAEGMLLVLCNSDENHEKQARYLSLLVAQQVAGIVIAPVLESAHGVLDALAGTPTVAVDRRIAHGGLDSVTLQNVDAARALTEHLLERTPLVAHLSGPVSSSTGRERQQGYRDALAGADVRVRPAWIVEGDFSEEGGHAAATRILATTPRPRAVFSANNLMTLGLLRAAEEAGLGPDDLAVATFGPLGHWGGTAHPVAALSLPTYEMGRTAARLLLERVAGGDGPARAVQLEHGHVLDLDEVPGGRSATRSRRDA